MKRIARVAILMATVAILSIPIRAASVAITDLTDGNPVVVISTDITAVQTIFAPEYFAMTGNAPPNVAAGTHSVILTEPATDVNGPNSDFITLFVSAITPAFSLTFESDTYPTFAADVAALPAGTPTLPENGNIQDVSSLLGTSGAFTITIQSDFASPEVPEPGTILLLAVGMIACGIGAWRRGGADRMRGRLP